MLFVIFLLVIASWSIYVLSFRASKKRQRLLELAAPVPTYEGALPFIGHAYKLIGGVNYIWEEFKKICRVAEDAGGVVKIWIASSPTFIINDPDDALTVMNSCLKKNRLYKLGEACCGNGLVIADVVTWKKNRKLLNPTFSQHMLDGFLHIFNKQSELLVQNLEPLAGTGEFDPEELFAENTLETTCQTVLGISLDYRSVIDRNYKKAVDTVFNLIVHKQCSIWLYIDLIYHLSWTKKLEEAAVSTMNNMSKRVIEKRRAERNQEIVAKTSSPRFQSFLDRMLDMVEDGLFTDEQMRQELNGMIVASYDTTAKAMISILVLVGSYPEVQEKIYKEIESVLGSNVVVDTEEIRKLVYTEAVVKEALRVSPVVAAVARDVEKEVKLKNYTLPAGSGCVVSLWGIHRLPIWGPDRYEFRPERWLDPASLPQSPGAYCAFSIGSRNCIGKTYALMTLKILLAHIIRKFRVTADYSKVKRKFEVFMRFVEGQHLSLELRNQC